MQGSGAHHPRIALPCRGGLGVGRALYRVPVGLTGRAPRIGHGSLLKS